MLGQMSWTFGYWWSWIGKRWSYPKGSYRCCCLARPFWKKKSESNLDKRSSRIRCPSKNWCERAFPVYILYWQPYGERTEILFDISSYIRQSQFNFCHEKNNFLSPSYLIMRLAIKRSEETDVYGTIFREKKVRRSFMSIYVTCRHKLKMMTDPSFLCNLNDVTTIIMWLTLRILITEFTTVNGGWLKQQPNL